MNSGEQFEKGNIYTTDGMVKAEEIGYNAHPKFKGVSLKHLVTGSMSGGKISCHLVKVAPFCTLEPHTHAENLEIHEVIEGDGVLFLSGNEQPYTAGSIGVIPAGTEHKVTAGESGIYILAKFTPPLV